MTDTTQYWFNVRTHQVEEGPQSDWQELLGPYPSREAAEGALAKVRANNEAADADAEDAADWNANPLDDAS